LAKVKLKRSDYSNWFRDIIKDRELADEAACIESDIHLHAKESRKLIGEAVTRRYTLPTKSDD
jgi:hypothetical protein